MSYQGCRNLSVFGVNYMDSVYVWGLYKLRFKEENSSDIHMLYEY